MSRPWMPLYIADYRKDTAHLSAAQHGAYLLLIMHYWSTGGLPNDDAQLARIASMSTAEWRRARTTVQNFFHEGWKHKRIDTELARTAKVAGAYAERARQAAEARWSKDASMDAPSMPQASKDGCLDMPISPSHSERKEDPPDGGSAYAFESGVIKLAKRDLDLWKASFSHLDVPAELVGMSDWAENEKNWFMAVKGLLTKRNREVGIRKSQQNGRPLTPAGNPWPEGIT